MKHALCPQNTRTYIDLPDNKYLVIDGNPEDGVVRIWLNGNQEVTAEYIDEFQDLDFRKIRYDQKHGI